MLAGRVNHTVLARLVAALNVDLCLLKLQTVMAKIKLVHIVASFSIAPLWLVFIRIGVFADRDCPSRVSFFLYRVITNPRFNLPVGHLLTQLIKLL
jgi:hypothetical protein